MTYHIQTFNAIAPEGLAELNASTFQLNNSDQPDAFILRSHNLHDHEFPDNLKAIARAGAGVNNIPVTRCTEKGIVVFNTPGANANAVKELVLASLLLSIRPIIQGAAWMQSLQSEHPEKAVEDYKKQFIGHELEGKRLGIIGLGAIGALVANDAYRLGMNVTGYDPYVSVDTAWSISRRVKRALSMDEVLRGSDFISVHVPLNEKTKYMIGKKELSKMKPTAVLLNFARGELVDNDAVVAAVNSRSLHQYITDFADNKILHNEHIVVLPHLGASTTEAEVNCAKVACATLKYYLETGNIVKSVNFPTTEMAFLSPLRVSIIHKNQPNMLGQISTAAADLHINIENLINRSRDDFAYTILDLPWIPDESLSTLIDALNRIDNTLRIRVLRKPESTF